MIGIAGAICLDSEHVVVTADSRRGMDDNVLFAHGPHQVVEDFEAAFARICPAFAELTEG